jgi:hypothetical protein
LNQNPPNSNFIEFNKNHEKVETWTFHLNMLLLLRKEKTLSQRSTSISTRILAKRNKLTLYLL